MVIATITHHSPTNIKDYTGMQISKINKAKKEKTHKSAFPINAFTAKIINKGLVLTVNYILQIRSTNPD